MRLRGSAIYKSSGLFGSKKIKASGKIKVYTLKTEVKDMI
jgi:hypothetical protein